MNKLSVLKEGATVEELRDISVSMRKYVDTENDATMQVALEKINSKPGLLGWLFPNQFTREQNRMTLERMRMIYKAKEDFFKIYTNVQLEIARKQGDALISAVGIDMQTRLTEFAQTKINYMSEVLEKSREDFFARIYRQEKQLEQYKDSKILYDRAMRSLKTETDTFFDSIDNLLEGFITALQSKLPK